MQQQTFPFDLSVEQQEIKSEQVFEHFERNVHALYAASQQGAAGIMAMGQALQEIEIELGPTYMEHFLRRRRWLTVAEARRYMRIYNTFCQRAIEGEVPFALLYVLGGISKKAEFDEALRMAKEGKTAGEIEDWLAKRREIKGDGGGGNTGVTEDDVKAALRAELEAEGAQIVNGEYTLANGMRVDLLTQDTIWECKVTLNRTRFYEAMGQTEAAGWEIDGKRRGLACLNIDADAAILVHQAQRHGIEIRKVSVRVVRRIAE